MAEQQDRGPRRTGSSFQDAFKEAGPYLTLGLELGLTMIIWTVIGYVLDLWLDTTPWLTLGGAVVGMISLFIQLVRAARRSRTPKGSPSNVKEE